jgi:hypothetical protein
MSWIYEDLGIPRLQRNESQASFRKRVKEWEDRNGKGAYKKYLEGVDRFGKSNEYRAITELAWESKLDQKRTYTTADAKDANREAAPKLQPLTSKQLDAAEKAADPKGFAIRNEPGYQEALAEELRESLQVSPEVNSRYNAAIRLRDQGIDATPAAIVAESKRISTPNDPSPNTQRDQIDYDAWAVGKNERMARWGARQSSSKGSVARNIYERDKGKWDAKWKTKQEAIDANKAKATETATKTALTEPATNRVIDTKALKTASKNTFSDIVKDQGQTALDKFNVAKTVKSMNPNTPGGAANLAKAITRFASSYFGPKDQNVTWARNQERIAKTPILTDELEDPWKIWDRS